MCMYTLFLSFPKAFGAPFIVVMKQKPEVFFGSDRFELIAHMLGKLYMMSVCQCVSPLHRSEMGRTTSGTGS